MVLSKMGHSIDLLGLQADAMFHMLSTFLDTGEVDDSEFEVQPMNFELELSYADRPQVVVKAAVAAGFLPATALDALF